MKKKNRFVPVVLFALALLFLMNDRVAFAQVSGSIKGTIEDASGAAVAGATVTITNMETGAVRTVLADDAGGYLVLSLPVGRYSLQAEKVGFKTAIESNLDLVVGQQEVTNLKLEVGETQQSVTVTAEVPVVNTTTASVSGLVGEQEVKELPLNGRSFDNLITLNTGAVNYTAYSTASQSGGETGNMFDVVGRRYEENLFLLNGVEYTGESNRSVQPGGVSGQLLGIDAVREFNVLTDTYSAAYGKRPGAQVTVVTQSGTNAIHGSMFEFLRNSHLDARNFFDAPPSEIGHRIPGFQRNQFGGALGGPIRKDKAFAFINYEGFRQRLGIADVGAVPDNNARAGMLPCGVISPLPTGCASKSDITPMTVPGFNPGMVPFFALWPQANGQELGGGVALFLGSPKESIREDFTTARFDQNLSSRDTLSEAYTVDDGRSFIPQADPFFAAVTVARNQVGSIQEVHIFSPEKINTARFGYSRGLFYFNVPPTIPFSSNLSLFAGSEPGQVNIGGGQTLSSGSTTVIIAGSSQDYDQGARNLFTYADDFQWVKGKHQISFGAWLQRMDDNRQGGDRKAGQASFSNITTFLQGTVSNFQGSVNPHPAGYRLWEGAWYVEDTIRLRSNLTLSVGLRHEFTNTLSAVNGQIANGVLDSTGIPTTNPVLGISFPKNYDKWMFGPRVGLAWDVFGNGKTAVRAGFGTFYSIPDYYQYIFDRISPFHAAITFGASQAFLPLIPETTTQPPACGVGVPTPCSLIAQSLIPDNKATTAQEWNLAIEQQIAPRTSLRVAYVGSHGIHEPTATNLDSIPPQICSTQAGCVSGGINKATGLVTVGTLYVPVAAGRPNPYLSAGTTYVGYNSSYNALVVDVKHSLSQGLQFRANYTWSKNLDIGTEPGGAESSNSGPQVEQPFNPKADWGPSSSDVTNAASISGSYELPIGHGKPLLHGLHGFSDKLASGWQTNSIVTLLGGFPFTVLVNSNQSGDGDTSNPDRPSWNPAFQGPIITGTPQQWYNPNAFMIPVSGTFGNVARSALRGPDLYEWDMSMFKETSLTEKTKLEFRAEFFNFLNHPNFSFPNKSVFSSGAISPSAGLITSTATSSRQIQFGLKLLF